MTWPGFEGQEAGFKLILFHLLIYFFFLEIAVLPCVPAQFIKEASFIHALYQGFAGTLNSELSYMAEAASTQGCSSDFLWEVSATTVMRAEWDVHFFLHHCL